jgi:hypothetical protein
MKCAVSDKAYKTAHELITQNRNSLDRIARKPLERGPRRLGEPDHRGDRHDYMKLKDTTR